MDSKKKDPDNLGDIPLDPPQDDRGDHALAKADQWAPRELKIGDKTATSLLPMIQQITEPKDEIVGTDNIDLEDMVLPELKLCQSVTDEVQEGLAKAGQYILTTTQEVFSPPLQVLLIFHSKGRALFPNDAKGTGHLEMCLSNDALMGTRYGDCEECPHKEWPTDEELKQNPNKTAPACSLQHNFVVLLPQGPAVVRFGRTSFKNAKKFLTAFKWSKQNLWSNVALLRVKAQKKQMASGQVTYYTHELVWDPQDRVPELYTRGARDAYDLLNDMHQQARLNMAGNIDED